MGRPYRLLSTVAVAVLAFVGPGCATFVKFSAEGTGAANTWVHVDSNPQGLEGTLDDGRSFRTPVNLVLRSDRIHTLTFTKEGAEPIVVELEPDMHNWVWGNILTLGFGCIFDAEKGSTVTLHPDEVFVTFEPEAETAAAEGESAPDSPESA